MLADALPKVLKTKVIPDGRVDDDGVLQDATGAQVIDDVLTAQARVMQPVAVQRLCRELRQRLDPDRVDRFDADAAERSTCSMRTDFAGMTILHLITDPVNGLLIRAAIARRSKPRPAGTAVEFYIVLGGGHAWPGSAFSQSIAKFVGYTTMQIDASKLDWAFFKRFALPAS